MLLPFTNLLKRVIFGRLARAVNVIAELLPSMERIKCFPLLEKKFPSIHWKAVRLLASKKVLLHN